MELGRIEMTARVEAVRGQREAHADQEAVLVGRLAVAEAVNADLQDQLKKANEELAGAKARIQELESAAAAPPDVAVAPPAEEPAVEVTPEPHLLATEAPEPDSSGKYQSVG